MQTEGGAEFDRKTLLCIAHHGNFVFVREHLSRASAEWDLSVGDQTFSSQ